MSEPERSGLICITFDEPTRRERITDWWFRLPPIGRAALIAASGAVVVGPILALAVGR